jgi:ABC-type siderophore export system fused ATPase/permease subunit
MSAEEKSKKDQIKGAIILCFTVLPTIAFSILKLCKIINWSWSWVWVISPVWICLGVTISIWIISIFIIGFISWRNHEKTQAFIESTKELQQSTRELQQSTRELLLDFESKT